MIAAVVWLIVGIALAVAEAFTGTLVLLMLAAGALVAAVTAGAGAPPVVQGIVFGAVSGLALAGIRPALRRHLEHAPDPAPRIGVDAIEGASGLVVERVDADHGLIKIEGELWTARSFDSTQVIEPGERVQVIAIKGATAMVWRD